MTAAQARRRTGQSSAKMASPAAADLISMFAQRNPKSSRDDLTEVGKLVAAFGATAAKLSPAARKRLIARKVPANVNEQRYSSFLARKRCHKFVFHDSHYHTARMVGPVGRGCMPTPFAKLAGAVMLATTTLALASAEAQAASSSPPVVAIVEIQAPWYAPDFVIRHKMRETIPEYAALPGLLFKYFSIAQGDKFGGIYLWRDAASAHAWFSPVWFDTVLRTRGAPAHVRFFEVLQAIDFTSGGVRRDAHSHDAATLLITSATEGTLPTASSQAGLLRRYSVRSEDGKLAWIDLWSSKAAAQAFFNSSELARLQQSMGAVQIEYFRIPIVLPSTLPENQQGDAS